MLKRYVRRGSKKLRMKSFSFNQVVTGGIHYACIINIIKIFFNIQKDFSQLVIIKIRNIGNNTTECIQEGHRFLEIV